jgi:uncharacterized protein
MSILTAKQQRVAFAALDEQSELRDHVVIALSGAHAYGFPSPDSDLDLKAIHQAPTAGLLGLDAASAAASTRDWIRVVEGVELDYTSNELGAAVAGILGGNGNYLERVLGPILLRRGPQLEGLQQIARGAVSRLFHRHYRGFAHNQLEAVLAQETPPAKRALYVLRTALTGAHLLNTGELVVDVTELLDDYGFGEAHELVARKRAGELTPLDAKAKAHWLGHLERAMRALEEARAASTLPEQAPNRDEANAWLVATRLGSIRATE